MLYLKCVSFECHIIFSKIVCLPFLENSSPSWIRKVVLSLNSDSFLLQDRSVCLHLTLGTGLGFNSLKPTDTLSTLGEALSSKCISLERFTEEEREEKSTTHHKARHLSSFFQAPLNGVEPTCTNQDSDIGRSYSVAS